MFWRSYGRVIIWLLAVGAVVGAAFFLVIFGLFIPPDRGEESVLVLIPFLGACFGLFAATASSVLYGLGVWLWTRGVARSVASRAWVGAGSAGFGVLALWLVFGFLRSGTYGLPVWGGIGVASAALAMLVAGPLTARAARRADAAALLPGADAPPARPN
jgi:heme exporter protein D